MLKRQRYDKSGTIRGNVLPLRSFVLAVVLLGSSTNAAIVDLGTITRDTVSGLEWLDVTETRGVSFSQVTAQFVNGGTLESWRYATTHELDQLITNWGYVPVNTECSYGLTNCDVGTFGDSTLIETIIRTLGDVGNDWLDEYSPSRDIAPDGAGYSYGFLADSPLSNDPLAYGLASISDFETIDRISSVKLTDSDDSINLTQGYFTDPDLSGVSLGSFLVRTSAIPLPATAWLFGSALLGLIHVRKVKDLIEVKVQPD